MLNLFDEPKKGLHNVNLFVSEKTKCELYNDNFQNYKRYGIRKAQLVIADIPYNLGINAYASSTEWYVDGDNKKGESKKAGKAFFGSDFNFNIAEYMHLYVDVDAYFNRIYSMQDTRIKAQNYYYYFTYVIGVYATFITERLSKQLGGNVENWNTFISVSIFKDMDNKRDSERLHKFIKWCEDDRNAYKYGAYMCASGSRRRKDFLKRLREMV